MEAERCGSRGSWKRKNAPPIVKEGGDPIRNRRGQKARRAVARNFTLKPMRSVVPEVRCDPEMLEQIRLKERTPKDDETHMSGNSSDPLRVELAGEYRSTSSAAQTMAMKRSTSDYRANEGQIQSEQLKRKAFDTQIRHDIQQQASRAKRMRANDMKPEPMHAITNPEQVEKVHLKQLAAEFKSARNKADDGAIFRLLTGERMEEPPAGKPPVNK